MSEIQPTNLSEGCCIVFKVRSSALDGHAALHHMVDANVSRSYHTFLGKEHISCS